MRRLINSVLLTVGFLCVCVDIGNVTEFPNDGFGYFIILCGLFLIIKKSAIYFLSIVLTIILIPLSVFTSIVMAFGEPSWNAIAVRCIPPLVTMPLGMLIAKHYCHYWGIYYRSIKKTYIFYFSAQVIDIACIAYFAPTWTSVLIPPPDVTVIFITTVPLIYFLFMLMYCAVFWRNQNK